MRGKVFRFGNFFYHALFGVLVSFSLIACSPANTPRTGINTGLLDEIAVDAGDTSTAILKVTTGATMNRKQVEGFYPVNPPSWLKIEFTPASPHENLVYMQLTTAASTPEGIYRIAIMVGDPAGTGEAIERLVFHLNVRRPDNTFRILAYLDTLREELTPAMKPTFTGKNPQ